MHGENSYHISLNHPLLYSLNLCVPELVGLRWTYVYHMTYDPQGNSDKYILKGDFTIFTGY